MKEVSNTPVLILRPFGVIVLSSRQARNRVEIGTVAWLCRFRDHSTPKQQFDLSGSNMKGRACESGAFLAMSHYIISGNSWHIRAISHIRSNNVSRNGLQMENGGIGCHERTGY